MANDKIVVATVAFVVPERVFEEFMVGPNKPDLLWNITALVPVSDEKGNYYRAIEFNKSYAEIQSIATADTGEPTDINGEYDTVYSVNRLVNRVVRLYKRNPEFPYDEWIHNRLEPRS